MPGGNQDIEGEMPVGIAATVIGLYIPQGIERRTPRIEKCPRFLGPFDRGGIESDSRAFIGVRKLTIGPIHIERAQRKTDE